MADITLPAGLGLTTLGATDNNINPEMKQAGLSLGELIKRTGEAVAQTQASLNATSARTADALANTMIDIIAVRERHFDDSGNINHQESAEYNFSMPLVNFVDNPFYSWEQVRVQGLFMASESTYENSGKSETTSWGIGGSLMLGGEVAGNMGAGMGALADKLKDGFGASGRIRGGYTNTDTSYNSDSSYDSSYGNMRMNAELRPRRDTGVAKPTQVIRGPSLAVVPGEVVNVHEDNDPAKPLQQRTMTVLIEYRTQPSDTAPLGTPIKQKVLGIEVQGVPWAFTGDSKTNDDGQVEIVMTRDFAAMRAQAEEEGSNVRISTTPESFLLTVRKGMVSNSSTVSF